MLNCKDTTKLVSDSLDRALTIGERLELWSHLLICVFCRHFRKDTLAMREMIRETSAAETPTSITAPDDLPAESRLSSSSKARLQAAITASTGQANGIPEP